MGEIKIELAKILDVGKQSVTVCLLGPDGREYKEHFFSGKEINKLKKLKKGDILKVKTDPLLHSRNSIKAEIIGIILPE
jgi:hypothetical protein